MPTADWYRTTADRLGAIAAQIVDTVNAVEAGWDNGVAIGGRVTTTTVDRAITASIANAATIAGELYTRADECRDRAVVGDDYTAASSQTQRASATRLPGRPTAPTRPAPWPEPST